jgi:hypothetical protein
MRASEDRGQSRGENNREGPSLGDCDYAQEDDLRARVDANWRWTRLIPTHLTGFVTGNPMNRALSVTVYASLVRQAGLRLDFSGTTARVGATDRIVDPGRASAGRREAGGRRRPPIPVFRVGRDQ